MLLLISSQALSPIHSMLHSPAVVAVVVPEVYVDGGAVVGDAVVGDAVVGDAVVGASDVGVVVLWHWHSVQ